MLGLLGDNEVEEGAGLSDAVSNLALPSLEDQQQRPAKAAPKPKPKARMHSKENSLRPLSGI